VTPSVGHSTHHADRKAAESKVVKSRPPSGLTIGMVGS
jgi:hypothetical protein